MQLQSDDKITLEARRNMLNMYYLSDGLLFGRSILTIYVMHYPDIIYNI